MIPIHRYLEVAKILTVNPVAAAAAVADPDDRSLCLAIRIHGQVYRGLQAASFWTQT